MDKNEIEKIKHLRICLNLILDFIEWDKKHKSKFEECKSIPNNIEDQSEIQKKYLENVRKKLKKIHIKICENNDVIRFFSSYTEGIFAEGIVKIFLTPKYLLQLEKDIKKEEEKYLVYLKEKEILENHTSMSVLTFMLVLITSFLSAQAILGEKSPFIIFTFGLGLFLTSMGIILRTMKDINKKDVYFILIIGLIFVCGYIWYYSIDYKSASTDNNIFEEYLKQVEINNNLSNEITLLKTKLNQFNLSINQLSKNLSISQALLFEYNISN